jgi:hypothetical protein
LNPAPWAVLVGYLYLGLHLCLKLWQLGGVEGLGGQLGLYRQAGDGRDHRQRVEARRTLKYEYHASYTLRHNTVHNTVLKKALCAVPIFFQEKLTIYR